MSAHVKRATTRADVIAVLAAEIRKRRDGCPILLAVQVLSAVNADNMTQAEVDAAFELADNDSR